MSFNALIQKVKQAEVALEASERRTAVRVKELKIAWKEGWTPARIVIAGLASGFLVGRAKPLRLAGGGGMLNMATALARLLAGGSASAAAEAAGQSADDARQAADAAEAVATPAGAGDASGTGFDTDDA